MRGAADVAMVLDASVALSWLFRDELTDISATLFLRSEDGIVVPAHWPFEIANGAVVAERKGRVGSDVVALWSEQILDVPTTVEPARSDAGVEMLPLARAHQLTVYDDAYLQLAKQRGMPLATFYRALIRAARSVGVALAAEQA